MTSAPAARHTLEILRYLGAQRGPVAAATIAAALDIPRSSIYRLLGVLEELGFVLHYPEVGRYGVGLAAFELGSGFTRQEPLARIGAPIIAGLVDEVGESAHLAVLHGRDVIYLVEERAPRRPSLVTDVGVRLPSYLTASGRAMLAQLPRPQLRALFPDAAAFVERGESTVRGYADLSRLLRTVHQEGFATEDGDITPGLSSIALAVGDHSGWPVASIAVTFASEGELERRSRILAAVQTRAQELARRLRARR